MSTPILATKLYIPPPRPKLISRPRLIERLNAGLQRKLTLISAPAGFGKTTLVSEWITDRAQAVAWLSLDEGDNDPMRFFAYLVAALQTTAPQLGTGVLNLLQSPQPAPPETILTTLLNEITTIPGKVILVLDDYHLLDAAPNGAPLGAIDQALTFLIEHLPPQLHLVIATREHPNLPLARLRARSQLTEVRAADLRFTPVEAAAFLNQGMGLTLSADEVAALEKRTEGWIAGLQLAAISMQAHNVGDHNVAGFIESFTGSHRFVMDYLVEEVLEQQPERVQTFLLYTSILDRLSGSLCDALLGDAPTRANSSGQTTLEMLEQANLFIVPLDNERRWYRYHHLFAELLRQRLYHHVASSTEGLSTERAGVEELHRRASLWYEAHGLELEAFHHATAANDIARAERLIEGKGMPLHFRNGAVPVLNWLQSLPTTVLDAWPSLWTVYASTLLVTGQSSRVEQTLQAAEAALERTMSNAGLDETTDAKTRDLIGRVAAIRSTAAAGRQQVEEIITYSQRALAYLHKDNVAFRTSTNWKLGYAYHLKGERAASRAYTDVIATGQASGNLIFTIMATIGLAGLQETENQLKAAATSYRRALELYGDRLLPDAGVAYLGLAQIEYEWNDLAAAQQHAQQSIQLAQQLERSDRTLSGEIFLARLQLAQGDVTGAAARLAQAEQSARRYHFTARLAEIAAAQVQVLLRQGRVAAAAQLMQGHELPRSQAQVHLAQGDPSTALALLTPFRQQMAAKGWADELLRVMVLLALAHHANREPEQALQTLSDALVLAAPGGFIRLFVDEGAPMAQLLSVIATQGVILAYVDTLLAALAAEQPTRPEIADQPLVEPLSERELEVLNLIAQGLSNREIGERLFLALDTVKGHNRRIFAKLQVQRRTEAVARAQALGLV